MSFFKFIFAHSLVCATFVDLKDPLKCNILRFCDMHEREQITTTCAAAYIKNAEFQFMSLFGEAIKGRTIARECTFEINPLYEKPLWINLDDTTQFELVVRSFEMEPSLRLGKIEIRTQKGSIIFEYNNLHQMWWLACYDETGKAQKGIPQFFSYVPEDLYNENWRQRLREQGDGSIFIGSNYIRWGAYRINNIDSVAFIFPFQGVEEFSVGVHSAATAKTF